MLSKVNDGVDAESFRSLIPFKLVRVGKGVESTKSAVGKPNWMLLMKAIGFQEKIIVDDSDIGCVRNAFDMKE